MQLTPPTKVLDSQTNPMVYWFQTRGAAPRSTDWTDPMPDPSKFQTLPAADLTVGNPADGYYRIHCIGNMGLDPAPTLEDVCYIDDENYSLRSSSPTATICLTLLIDGVGTNHAGMSALFLDPADQVTFEHVTRD